MASEVSAHWRQLGITLFSLKSGVLNFLNGFSEEPETIIIDMDPTVNKTYGDQQLTLFNGFVDDYCLMPFHVFDGVTGQLMTTVLRPGTTPSGTEIVTVLRRIEQQIRSRFKKTTLIFRADSHHCRPEVLELSLIHI